jgi:hypothetical protein
MYTPSPSHFLGDSWYIYLESPRRRQAIGYISERPGQGAASQDFRLSQRPIRETQNSRERTEETPDGPPSEEAMISPPLGLDALRKIQARFIFSIQAFAWQCYPGRGSGAIRTDVLFDVSDNFWATDSNSG